MLDLLKKYGIPSGVATLVVLLITAVPLYLQYKTTVEQNVRISTIEHACGTVK